MKKILVVGGGGIGKRHIDGFLRTGKCEVSVCEIDSEKIEQIKQTYQVSSTFSNFNSIDLSCFDAVVIATPANYHVSMAKKCVLECVPFMLEKPLSISLDGVEELLKAIGEKKILCGVGYTRRSIPSYRKLKDLINSGIAGEIKMANFYCGQDYRKIRTDYSQIYFAKKEMGGGVLRDFITHFIDLAQWFIGKPEKGYVLQDNLVFGDVIETDDSAVLIGRFSGKLVSFYCNAFQKPNEFIIDLAGTKGNLKYVLVNRFLSRILFANDDSGEWKVLGEFRDEAKNYYVFQAEHFLELLEGKPNDFTTIEEAAENLKFILDAIENSKPQLSA
ncbi:MAG TPA: Gfo/Idh/MocA family oxidoreductase [bacterium]|nr:Gfo/Idh/MocA family oxidoreductase [bacterium]HOL35996.1 Gfo/Idh/MocA family oxidoreductase [bacterium]